MAGAAAWISFDMRYQRIGRDAAAQLLVIEFEAALEQEIRESNARRFELADYLRNVTGH